MSSQEKNEQTQIVPVIEEEVVVKNQPQVTGRVRVRTITEMVDDVARATLEEHDVEVRRIPKNEIVGTPPSVRTEGDTTIVPVLEEVLVVEKRLLLKEELHIQRRTRRERVEVPVSRRKQRAIIDRLPELKEK